MTRLFRAAFNASNGLEAVSINLTPEVMIKEGVGEYLKVLV